MVEKRSLPARRLPRSRQFDSVTIAAFRSLVAVVETGGLSAAARRLGLVVSTVSKHVDILEARLQTNLFMRTTRKVTPTDAGMTLYGQSKLVLGTLDEIVDATFAGQSLQGRLRIVAPPSFSTCILAPALPAFLNRHPELQVEIRVTTTLPDFVRDGVDLAITMNIDPTTVHRVERIGSAPSILCASPEYLRVHGEPKHPEDLEHHRCLGGISSPYSESWKFQIAKRSITIPMRCRFYADTGEVLRNVCAQGLGIAGFFQFHVQADLDAGRLVPVLQKFQADVSSLYVVRHDTRYVSPNIVAFIAFLREIWARRDASS